MLRMSNIIHLFSTAFTRLGFSFWEQEEKGEFSPLYHSLNAYIGKGEECSLSDCLSAFVIFLNFQVAL